MSGCVNCVWDAYREEVEVWAANRRGGGDIGREVSGDGGVGNLDGSGYEGTEVGDEEMFKGVPVGIREFMNTEKRLRERRAMEKRVVEGDG